MNHYIFFLVLITWCFGLNLNNPCNVCECKPQNDIQICICQPSTDTTECERESHKLLISGHEILIPEKFSLNIIQSIVIKNININELLVSFTNELLPKLYRLEFDHCNLTQIKKEAFFNVQNLTQLVLKNNGELHLETDSFNYVQNLTCLDLEKNKLNDFPVNIFDKLSKLEKLCLDYNKLKNLSKEILQFLPNLQRIQIKNNEIQFIKNDLFESNKNLTTINLNANKIEFLNRTVVEKLNKLEYLYLDNNPLNCNCSLRDLHDEYKKAGFKISGECKNNGLMFFELKRKHFTCPAKLISISKTQNDNSFTLNCTIESDGRPNVKWLYENNSLAGVEYNEPYFMYSERYYSILELKVDPQKYYENNLTCLLENIDSNETMYQPIIYLPEVIQTKLNNFTLLPYHPSEQEEFEIKNVSNKIILTYNFTTRKNDFNITWSIQTLQSDKNIGLIFNLTNLKTNEYSADLILGDFNESLTGECTLFVIDDSSETNISKKFNIKNDINTTELIFSFQYKDKLFYSVESNNGFCNFVNDTQFVDSELGQSYQYTCYIEPYKIGYLKIALFVFLFIVSIVIILILFYCKCKKCTIPSQYNQGDVTSEESLISDSKLSPCRRLTLRQNTKEKLLPCKSSEMVNLNDESHSGNNPDRPITVVDFPPLTSEEPNDNSTIVTNEDIEICANEQDFSEPPTSVESDKEQDSVEIYKSQESVRSLLASTSNSLNENQEQSYTESSTKTDFNSNPEQLSKFNQNDSLNQVTEKFVPTSTSKFSSNSEEAEARLDQMDLNTYSRRHFQQNVHTTHQHGIQTANMSQEFESRVTFITRKNAKYESSVFTYNSKKS